MSETCRKIAQAIDVAAGDENQLSVEIAAHIEQCEACRMRRDTARRIATLARGGGISSEAALALARSAIASRGERRTVLWAAPLLSASMTIACLILYFGLGLQPTESRNDTLGTQASTAVDQSQTYSPSLEATQELSLPESFQAINGLMLTSRQEEEL